MFHRENLNIEKLDKKKKKKEKTNKINKQPPELFYNKPVLKRLQYSQKNWSIFPIKLQAFKPATL